MIPVGDDLNCRLYILKLNKIVYGLKQVSRNWYEKLKQNFIDQDFTPSKIDPCIFMKYGVLLIVYVDDCIILAGSEARIDLLIHSLKYGKEEGLIDKFLGISISKLDDN